jgi:hypothetical protein
MNMEGMEKFDKLAGAVFGLLYEEFPVPVNLTPETFLESVIDEDDSEGSFGFPVYFDSTIKWLESAGYIMISKNRSTLAGHAYDVVLSKNGLAALSEILLIKT